MSEHTKGPWEISVSFDGEHNQWDVCGAGGGDQIANLNFLENAESNARLIAAAPETAAERDRLKALLGECGELIAHYATEYEIGDEASELQHWPMAEVERCQKAVSLRNRLDTAFSRATEKKG